LPRGGSKIKVLTEDILKQVDEAVSMEPDITLKEIKKKLENQNENLTISLTTINNALEKIMITIKKPHIELVRVNEDHYIDQRKTYALWFNEMFANGYEKAIFVDESPFNLHLKRSIARSKKGTRANVKVPTIRGRSVSLLASISIDGMGFSKVIDNSTVNGAIFADYIRELCNHLKVVKGMTNACIILDNARIHRKQDMESITSEFNFQFRFLSPYSYMLNPIETAFSKIKISVKELLRNTENGSLSNFIMIGVGTVTPNDCGGFFRHMTRNLINSAAGLPYNHC